MLRIAFSLAAAFVSVAGCADKPSVGVPPPSIASDVLDLDGHPFDCLADSAGNILVVIFSRTDCPISNRFAPEIRGLVERFRPRGVEFFLVYVDPAETPDVIRRHLSEYHYPCRALRDPKHALVAHCSATTTPEAVVFNKDREITYRGRINDLYVELGQPRPVATTHDLADAIEAAFAGSPVANRVTKPVGCPIADLR